LCIAKRNTAPGVHGLPWCPDCIARVVADSAKARAPATASKDKIVELRVFCSSAACCATRCTGGRSCGWQKRSRREVPRSSAASLDSESSLEPCMTILEKGSVFGVGRWGSGESPHTPKPCTTTYGGQRKSVQETAGLVVVHGFGVCGGGRALKAVTKRCKTETNTQQKHQKKKKKKGYKCAH
jgi:hypothetical protein